MRKANQTSFKKGMKRTLESIEKQRQAIKLRHAEGRYKNVDHAAKWNQDRKEAQSKINTERALKKYPYGTKRLHKAADKLLYIVVKCPDSRRWKYEHRLVMEKKLNRKLEKYEIVHHKNHNTLDNNINNLELMTHSEHSKHHGLSRNHSILLKSVPRLNGRWSKKYMHCVFCELTTSKHVSNGLCHRCNTKLTRWGYK